MGKKIKEKKKRKKKKLQWYANNFDYGRVTQTQAIKYRHHGSSIHHFFSLVKCNHLFEIKEKRLTWPEHLQLLSVRIKTPCL